MLVTNLTEIQRTVIELLGLDLRTYGSPLGAAGPHGECRKTVTTTYGKLGYPCYQSDKRSFFFEKSSRSTTIIVSEP